MVCHNQCFWLLGVWCCIVGNQERWPNCSFCATFHNPLNFVNGSHSYPNQLKWQKPISISYSFTSHHPPTNTPLSSNMLFQILTLRNYLLFNLSVNIFIPSKPFLESFWPYSIKFTHAINTIFWFWLKLNSGSDFAPQWNGNTEPKSKREWKRCGK